MQLINVAYIALKNIVTWEPASFICVTIVDHNCVVLWSNFSSDIRIIFDVNNLIRDFLIRLPTSASFYSFSKFYIVTTSLWPTLHIFCNKNFARTRTYADWSILWIVYLYGANLAMYWTSFSETIGTSEILRFVRLSFCCNVSFLVLIVSPSALRETPGPYDLGRLVPMQSLLQPRRGQHCVVSFAQRYVCE